MPVRDSGLGFGLVSLAGHWVGASLMLLFIGICLSSLALDGPAQDARLAAALPVGTLCLVVSGFRIFWRLKHPWPMPLTSTSPAKVLAGRGVAFGLLLAGVILPLLLWAMHAAAGNWGLVLAGLFWVGIVAFVLGFLLHLYAALTHQFVQKDSSLARMLGKKIDL